MERLLPRFGRGALGWFPFGWWGVRSKVDCIDYMYFTIWVITKWLFRGLTAIIHGQFIQFFANMMSCDNIVM